MDKFFVYILRSEIHNKHYIGQTKDIEVRFKHHNSPRAKWTKRFQPWIIVHSEECSTRSEAMRREKELKKIKDLKKFLKQAGVTQL